MRSSKKNQGLEILVEEEEQSEISRSSDREFKQKNFSFSPTGLMREQNYNIYSDNEENDKQFF